MHEHAVAYFRGLQDRICAALDRADGGATFREDAWDRPSLCEPWTVRDIVAHLVATAYMTPPKFFAKLAGSRFDFAAMSNKEIRQYREGRSGKDGRYRNPLEMHLRPSASAIHRSECKRAE